MTRRERQDLFWGLLFVSPWVIGLAVFILIPALMALYYSFTDFNVLNVPVFIGFSNYQELAFDSVFWQALWNTVVYAALALPLGTILSLLLAIMLNAKVMGLSIFRTIYFLPSLVPLVASAVLFQWILNSQYGVINVVLGWFGIQGPNWLGDANWSKIALVITTIWGTGNAVVIYLAGLQDIPKSLYECADIEGANWYQKILNVTLPMLSPVIYFNLMMGCIFVMQEFVRPFIMFSPEGSPARSTLLYTMYLFSQAFNHLNMGYACAMGVILFLIIALFTWLVHSFTHQHIYYGGE